MTKTSRATNIQVPGAAPNEQQGGASTDVKQPDTGAGDAAGASNSSEKPETTGQAGAGADAGPAFDLETLRAQIRQEEQARARAELANQIHAASTVIGAGDAAAPAAASTAAPLTKGDYKNMRADQVDPKTLTAPVMTLDGWVCPVPPEAKK
jgi:hypothetical protein